MQIARNKLVRRARYFSTSKHYPEIGGEVDEGELSEMAPSKQATFTKLFDEISFASSSENVEDIKMTKTKQPSKSFAACFSCTDRRMPKPIEEEPYEIESIGSPKSMDVPISSEIENSSTLVVIEKDLAIQTFDASSDVDQEYPLITEPYTDEISTLNLIPEIEYSTLQKNERMEEKLMAEEPFTKEYSDEFQTSENIFSEESQWISGMPEVIPTESHHEIITTQRVTSETTTFVEPTEVQEEPTKTFTNFEQVLSDYPQLTAAYETEINTLTKVSEVSPSEFKKYEESSVEPAVIIESPVVTLEEQAVDKREYETPIIFTEQQPIIAK
uniref:Uncharacterized protein n=1 Tax=Panagrolaimus superbus TaxID=310955 RepID=A0A914YPT1_9BILA